jgi:8-oxo-dGTP pyrophosphatase MutT (NUDIX family)
MNEHADQPVRPAATVIIARDAQPQYEIFMLRRTNQAAFAGGMFVFPGGRVDADDHADYYEQHRQGPSPEQLPQQQALGDDWCGYWIAGIRETFEEAGIMLAYNADGNILSYEDHNRDVFESYRHRLHDSDINLAEICAREKLNLAVDLIHFFNRWITPPGRPRRFYTRFFITEAPTQQVGFHDGKETVDSTWISPDEALRLNAAGEFGMMAVTVKQLSDLAQHQTVKDLISMARNNREFPTHRPVLPPGA